MGRRTATHIRREGAAWPAQASVATITPAGAVTQPSPAVTEPSLDGSLAVRKSASPSRTLARSSKLGLATNAGCGESTSPGSGAAPNSDVGNVGLALQLVPGVVVNTFSYAITGPKGYNGTIDVSSSTKVTTIIGGIAAGAGYSLTLTAMSADGQTSCAGASTPFAVMAAATTSVSIAIDCHVGGNTTGSVLINGTINICPNVDSVASNPPVGNTIAITAAARDPDAGPQGFSSYASQTDERHAGFRAGGPS